MVQVQVFTMAEAGVDTKKGFAERIHDLLHDLQSDEIFSAIQTVEIPDSALDPGSGYKYEHYGNDASLQDVVNDAIQEYRDNCEEIVVSLPAYWVRSKDETEFEVWTLRQNGRVLASVSTGLGLAQAVIYDHEDCDNILDDAFATIKEAMEAVHEYFGKDKED